MSGRKARGGPRPLRRLALCVESLDARQLLSSGIGPPTATVVAPATVRPLTYVVPQANVLPFGTTAIVTVPPNGAAAGFIASVPLTNIRLITDQIASVAIPVTEIPAGAARPTQNVVITGTLSDVY